MSHEKLSYDETKEHTALSNLDWLGLWCGTGSEWTSTIREEFLAVTNQPLEKGQSRSTRGIALLGVAALALLGAATLIQTPVAFRIPQENAKAVSTQ